VAAEFDSIYEDGEEERLQSFLERIALISDVDNLSDEGPPVLLMTLHSAKGLEFPVVFLAGMEERLFPHSRAIDEGNLEEERRLCYVGITRAKERLYLTRAKQRRVFSEPMHTQPSRFLEEIPPELLEDISDFGSGGRIFGALDGGGAAPPPPVTRDSFRVLPGKATDEKLPQDWRVGQALYHSKWGVGHIKEIKDLDGDQVLTVLFPREGVKKIMARYAPIRIAEG
jgi:DNA helicase II / ATP-dependent DNA helicase PcrA